MDDREILKQMLERDVINLYRQLPQLLGNFGVNISPYLGIFENKILSYADMGIDTAIAWLFGSDPSSNIDEAADIAKMMTNDKIEEYRRKVKEEKEKQNEES